MERVGRAAPPAAKKVRHSNGVSQPFDSFEEGRVICARACGLGLGDVDAVMEGCALGHTYGQWDWACKLPKAPHHTLLFDYDGGYFHPPERAERDRTKSLTAVRQSS